MGLLDRFGFLGGAKMNSKAGEWAAKAMACMVFADGRGPGDAEIAAVRLQIKTNRVLTESIGSKAAEALFHRTVEAIRSLPSVYLQTHVEELAVLARAVTDPTEKNFTLATVIAVAMGDGTVTLAEQAMLLRFREMLGATIVVPAAGQTMQALDQAAIGAGIAQPTPAQQGPVNCPTCQQPTQFYEGYGHWCPRCQQYAAGPTSPEQRARQDTPEMPLPAVDGGPKV